MLIGVGINAAVQQNAPADTRAVLLPVMPFYKIPDKIADQRFFVAEGEKTMCEMIQVDVFFSYRVKGNVFSPTMFTKLKKVL